MSPKQHKRLVLHVKTIMRKLACDLSVGPSDVAYCLRRLHHEGVAFVTKTLPLFSKFAIKCCDTGVIPCRSTLTNFEWKGSAPRFLRGLLFEAISGSASALFTIRQFCEYWYKTAFSFTESQLKSAEDKYVQVDDSIELVEESVLREYRRALHQCFPRLCEVTLEKIFRSDPPRDGPGAFAQTEYWLSSRRSSPGYKTRPYGGHYEIFKKQPTEKIGSHDGEFNAYSGYFRSYPSSKEILYSMEAERLAALAFVPKDSRGPRTISKEPYFLLKAQMGFQDYLSRMLTFESRGSINFSDQGVNVEYARRASIDRAYCTIDLKDASDLVSDQVVSSLFQHTSALRFMTVFGRSTHVIFPSGKIRKLKKFANMGSGVCFPTLSLVVFLAAFVATTRRYPAMSINEKLKRIHVYGDDLIVPSCDYDVVTRCLAELGLSVNSDKSFWRGHFRESCGGDFYHGHDVAPVRLRLAGEKLGPVANYRNGHIPVVTDAGVLQLERHCRELYDKGLHSLTTFYYKQLLSRLGYLPPVSRESSILGIYDPLGILGVKPTSIHSPGFFPKSVETSWPGTCPYKLMGPRLKPGRPEICMSLGQETLGADPYRVPLRYRIVLKKRRVLGTAELFCYGIV